MDIQDKIQLGENRFVDAVNVDTSIKIGLESKNDLNIEYNIQNVLDVTQVFDDERQATTKYRIHGEIEYLSILNNIPTAYRTIEDFFSIPPQNVSLKNINTDLKIYLVKPSTGFTEIILNERYIKNYEVIAEVTDIEIIEAGFAKNVFNEQQYSYIINMDIDIGNTFDGLGFPITELSLYIEYQKGINGNSNSETMERKSYDSNGNTTIINFDPIPLNTGDVIEGDVINYDINNFSQSDFNLMEHYIYTPYDSNTRRLKWKYRPFIPLTLRFFETELRRVNTGTTAYEDLIRVPDYAVSIDNDGNLVWRNILDNGFFDPIEDIGVAFPFINQRHYVYNSNIFRVQPDLTDSNTATVFTQINLPPTDLISSTPNSSLDDIGNICD